MPAVSTRIAGLVDFFSSPSKLGTNNSIPTNFSVASLLMWVGNSAESTAASASTAKITPLTSLINARRALIFDQASTPFKVGQ